MCIQLHVSILDRSAIENRPVIPVYKAGHREPTQVPRGNLDTQLEVNTKNIPKEKHNNKKVFFIIKDYIKKRKKKKENCALYNKSTEPKAKKDPVSLPNDLYES